MSHHVVRLNVGGALFDTTAATLTGANIVRRGGAGVAAAAAAATTAAAAEPPIAVENPYFSTLLAAGTRDADGRLFIDRDPSYFAVVLQYLRTGEWVVPPGLSEAALRCGQALTPTNACMGGRVLLATLQERSVCVRG